MTQGNRIVNLALAALVAGAAAAGCGYTLAARPDLPGGVERVSVPVVEADLPDVEVGSVFGRALAARAEADDRLARRGGGAELRVRITRMQVAATAFPANVAGAGLYTLSLQAELRLEPPGGGHPLRRIVVSGSEPYLAGRGPEATEANRRRALSRLARRLAGEAWSELVAPPPPDAGVPAADAGVPAADAGVPAGDAGVPSTDAGVPQADGGSAPADGGTADAGP